MRVSLLLFLAVASVTSFAQTTWYVDDDAPGDPGPGDSLVSDPLEDGSSAHPFDGIQEAIDVASTGDTVLLLDGVYTGAGNRDLNFGGRDLTLTSQNGASTTWISKAVFFPSTSRLLTFEQGETNASLVRGITFINEWQRASSLECGDTVLVRDAGPTFEACVFRDPRFDGDAVCPGGSALYFERANSVVRDCLFEGSRVEGGFFSPTGFGGAVLAVDSTVILERCTFHDNDNGGALFAGYGGALAGQDSNMTLRACVFMDNRSAGGGTRQPGNIATDTFPAALGGAAGFVDCSVTIEDCVFQGNRTGSGARGGEDLEGQAGGDGGALYMLRGTLDVRRTHFIDNRCGAGGSGPFIFPGPAGRGGFGGAVSLRRVVAEFRQCVFAENRAGDAGATGPGGTAGDTGRGGALHIGGTSVVTLLQCSLLDNLGAEPAPEGTVFYAEQEVDLTIRNLLARGPAPQWSGNPDRITVSYTNFSGGFAGAGNIDADPLFGFDPYRPIFGSPGNDAGDNSAVPPDMLLDADGAARFADDPARADGGSGTAPIVDMGAFEVGNGMPNPCDVYDPNAPDCDGDGIPATCEEDCDGNGLADTCDLQNDPTLDCDGNGRLDSCELSDCNGNGILDVCDLNSGQENDCNDNGVPDSCEPEEDCDGNGIPDSCELLDGSGTDCNNNGIIDACESEGDCNDDGVPDDCEEDCDLDGIPDVCELPAQRDRFAVSLQGDTLLSFDAFSQYDITSEEITIEVWVRPTGDLSGTQNLVRRGDNYWLRLVDGQIRFAYRNGDLFDYVSDLTLVEGIWQHIAVTHTFGADEAQGIQMYLDGQPVSGAWLIAPVGNPVINPGNLLVANNGAQRRGFVGGLDELRVWNTRRTQGQIQATLLEIVPRNEPDLVAYLPFDSGSGTVRELVRNRTDGLDGGTWQPLVNCDACPDVNGDGTADLTDLAILLGNFGQVAAPEDGDLSRDGRVDLTDLVLLLSGFGAGC